MINSIKILKGKDLIIKNYELEVSQVGTLGNNYPVLIIKNNGEILHGYEYTNAAAYFKICDICGYAFHGTNQCDFCEDFYQNLYEDNTLTYDEETNKITIFLNGKLLGVYNILTNELL